MTDNKVTVTATAYGARETEHFRGLQSEFGWLPKRNLTPLPTLHSIFSIMLLFAYKFITNKV